MKKIWLALLTSLMFVCLAIAVGCGYKPPFNEGYLTEIVLGEPIMIDEYIDPDTTEDYSLILTCDETGEQYDLKELFQWTTDKPGMYTLKYTIKSGDNKGTNTTKIKVVVPKASWQYTRPTLKYRVGETMPFAYLSRVLNIYVKSYYDYEFLVKSIYFNNQAVDMTEETEYTFTETGEHIVTFAVITEDGQELSADLKITIRPEQILAEGAQEWMTENNITAEEYTYISADGEVVLDSGIFNSYLDDNVPYIAFNGEEGVGYGAKTYAMADFTGKNLPQVAFFVDEVTPSFVDGNNGILFTNGITNNAGKDFLNTKLNMSRLTIFGPKKVSFPEFDNKGRMLALGSEAEPCPMSYHALSDTDSYRYIVGIEEANKSSVLVRILLINMSTGERVFDYRQKLTSSSGFGALDLSSDYFKGSIVFYGRYGKATKLDKVYTPITGISDIYELDKAAPFKTSYKAQYDLNASAWVSDYIDIPDGDYEFIVKDPDGMEVEIDKVTGEFKYTKSGKYMLYYDPLQTGVRASAVTVRVMYDLDNAMPEDYLEFDGPFIGSGDVGIQTNTSKTYIKEGNQSLENYTINGTEKTISIYVSKNFMEFLFLSRRVKGITFEVYSSKAATFKLNSRASGVKIAEDYTGEIPAETWTKLTITRDLCMKNMEVYKNNSYSVEIMLTAVEKEFYAREKVYLDNVQLIVDDVSPTISDGAKTWMETNNVEAYGYSSITDDMQVNLQDGRYQSEWWKIANDDVPYVAYKGNYAAGSYVVADFTGKNIPQIALFVDKATSSLIDGNKGLYIHTGMIKKDGNLVSDIDGGRITFLGPKKMEYTRPDAEGRVGKQFGTKAFDANGVKDEEGKTVSPLSIRGLQDGVHYRYVVGIKTAREEGATKGRIVLELLLINLDTKEEVVRYEWSEATEGLHSLIGGGNIVLYGRLNTAITLDKIYPVHTGVSDIYAIDEVAEVLG